ncbi:hypothetical protein [Psychrobium sp. 1_MG-2023]|uniref:hypothetical protein n=1 Tax=Psychrobium sp. 1_MG-2023 TaxID=3062624 RepID=UPI00273613B0|nr:hypothetical protein [Psychrobium sp. 1_MG-2023]MDP2559796.1 hypothetical protein [Psychrobium sp. 1_MG-2023]
MKSILLSLTTIIFLAGCASTAETTDTIVDKTQSEHCKALRKKIDDLKGNPVRRTTAREYYQKDCLQ